MHLTKVNKNLINHYGLKALAVEEFIMENGKYNNLIEQFEMYNE